MRNPRWLPAAVAVAATLAAGSGRLQAQVTSGTIGGTVTDESGAPVAAAQIQITNRLTGYNRGALTREDGRYTIAGLEVGAGYAVTVRRIGYAPVTRENVRVTLGQTTRLDVALTRQAAQLTAVTVQAAAGNSVISPTRTGVATTISDSALSRLPTLGRNFTDFVALTPQVSNAGPGLSGGGVNNRFNAIQIDGAYASDAFGLGSTGQPGGQAGGRSISILAVKEYQVLLSPFDVRQGTFSGLLVNAVTQSGTNDLRGTFEVYGRNERLQRQQDYLNDFQQYQYAGAVGGPLVKDRAFFFLNADAVRQQSPAGGPFVGSRDQTVPTDSITRLQTILQNQYGIDAGGGELYQNENPLTNVFGRIDVNLPAGNRLVLRHNFAAADQDEFSRGANTGNRPSFNLTSNRYFFRSRSNQTAAQLYSNLANGISNELIVGYSTVRDARTTPQRSPQITVVTARRDTVTGNALATGTSQIVAGAQNSSHANSLDQDFVDLTNNLTIPIGAHRLTLGTQNRFYRFNNVFGQNAFGTWSFNSLDSLARGIPAQYQVGVPAAVDDGAARFDASQYSAYVQDEWQVTSTFGVTAGVRAEYTRFGDQPPLNESVRSAYGIRTDVVPRGWQVAPRIGFNWDVTGDARNQLRGGVGSFVGSPAYVWLGNAFQNSGLSGYASLNCNSPNLGATAAVSLAPPAFNAQSIANPPQQCAPGTRAGQTVPGATAALGGAINVIDPDFKLPQFLKGSLGYDRRVGQHWVVSLEGLYTKTLHDVFYTNLALPDAPVGSDVRGRPLYGTFGSAGAVPAFRGGRTQVLNIENTSRGWAYNLTGQVQRNFADRYSASLAYTYSQARDVASTANSTAGSNFGLGRSISGPVTEQNLGRSRFEQPHRVVATASYSFPTLTDVSLIYTGQSGFNYDFSYGGNGSFGDLNADGQRNDLFYVPRSAADPREIRLSGTPAQQQAQAVALDRFIESLDCLREQRGRFMARNSCRTPWTNNVNVRVEQSLRTFRAQRLSLRAEVFNLGNLLNRNWGEVPTVFSGGSSFIVSEVAKVNPATGAPLTAAAQNAEGVFTFDTNQQRFNANNVASNYRIQLSARYSF